MFLVGFTGYSGSGKTTLAARVVACLKEAGRSVSCIKDAHHHVEADTPGKDTWRYREAGAQQVVLRTPERWVVMEETPQGRIALADILRVMRPVDIIVAEGFKREGGFPRIEVRRRGCETPPLWLEREDIVAVATDDEALEIPGRLARLDVNDPQAVARFVLQLFEQSLPPSKDAGA